MINRQLPHPPKWVQSILRRLCKPHLVEEIEGDLLECYHEWVMSYGVAKADRLYVLHAIKFLRPYALKSILKTPLITRHLMLKNHIEIARRQLIKNKIFALLNIGGLSMGITVASLIGLWVWDEVTFDQYHQNYDRVARVLQNQTFAGGDIQTWRFQALQLGTELRSTYGASFKYISMADFGADRTLLHQEKALTKRGMFMEANAPRMLSLNMLKGTLSGLKEPNSILLSASTAKSFFGDDNPINKIVSIDDFPEVKVTGVFEDLPHNSSFADLEFIAPWELFEKSLPEWLTWGNSWFQTIVQIADNAEMEQVSAIIKNAKLNRMNEKDGVRFKPELFLHPMKNWHLYAEFKQGINTGGRIQYVWLFGLIGLFVLFLACINFMNLSTARSEKRAKEVGVRKAVGSDRKQLIYQFFIESILVSLIAFVLSLLFIQLILPYFNQVTDKEITILWVNPLFWILGLGFTLLAGLLAGSYPALYISSFRAINVLKGKLATGKASAMPRKVLVVLQFTVSVTLIIGTVIVFQQIQYVKVRPLGYTTNQLLMIPIKNALINDHYEAFRYDMLQTGMIEEVAKSISPITGTFVTNSGLEWRGKAPGMQDEFVSGGVTHEFGKTVSWEITQGRDFSRDFKTDSLAMIINEAAVDYMGFENPIGEQVRWPGNGTFTIIGVVRDMVTQSPYSPSKQTFYRLNHGNSNLLNIKIKPNKSPDEALAKIEAIYKKYDPVNPFDYNFADQQHAEKFINEERIGKLASFFAVLAIFISFLGLFGMAAFVTQQRMKEISIRKVLGASTANLWEMLSKDFIVLVGLSCVIASAIAYYFFREWLLQYDYRTPISYSIFVLASIGALLVTVLTVSYHTIKAAITNPVDSLRLE